MFFWLASALAHHGTTPNQVVPEVAPRTTASAAPGLTLDVGLGWRTTAHHGVFRNGVRTDNVRDARITSHVLTPTVRLGLPTGTGVSVALPMGGTVTHVDSQRSPHLGLGDLVLRVDQRLGPVGVFLGGTAPTGSTGGNIEMTDVSFKGSELAMQSYDTRASLGTGAWSALGGAALVGRIGSFAGDLDGWAQVPLGESRDAVRWGSTFGARGAVGVARGPITAQATIGARHHLQDRWEDVEAGPSAGGRRSQLAVGAALRVRPRPGMACSVDARVPVWRAAQGTQLVETFAMGASCTQQITL